MTPLLWVVGAGGLLGSALTTSAPYDLFEHRPIRWTDDDAPAQLDRAAAEFRDARGSGEWVVAWCAGAGVIGTDDAALAGETLLFETLLAGLGDGARGTVFLASSAGGVYGGVRDLPITEDSPTAPLSSYGENKLLQERLLDRWTEQTGARAVVGRISNLYGPGQSLEKSQGLISHVCLATLRRRPITLYVPLDTIRDYMFVDDCAALIVDVIVRAHTLPAGTCRTKILASGRCTSIGTILNETRRILRRRPAVVSVPSTRSGQQPPALSFRSTTWTDLDRRTLTTIAAGIDCTARGLQAHLRQGTLS